MTKHNCAKRYMYKIGEFSKIVAITVKALRYYDEIGILSPAIVSEENGYRYYDHRSYEKAIYLRTLKKYGFTIKEISEVLPNVKNREDLSYYLLEKSEMLEVQIMNIKKLQKQITNEVSILEEVITMKSNQAIEKVIMPKTKIASIRVKSKYNEVGKYFSELYKVAGSKAVGKAFCLYYDGEYTEENADIEICIEVKEEVKKGEITTRELPEATCISILHIGSYDTLSSSYKVLVDYIHEHGLETYVPSREIYVKGPGMIFKGNPSKYETKIMMPLA